MTRRQQGTRPKPTDSPVRAVRFEPDDFKTIATAAKQEAIPFSVFVRSAALREARRILTPTAA